MRARIVSMVSAVSLTATALAGLSAQTPTRRGSVASAPPVAQKAMTNNDVMQIVAAGLSEEVVKASVRDAKSRQFDTSPTGLIQLKKAGVSDSVIALMMNPRAGEPAASAGGAKTEPPKSEAPKNAVGETVLPDGIEVKMRLLQAVSSAKAKVDEKVRFEAAEDVLVKGKVVIAQGAAGIGTVTEAKEKKNFGRRGKLNFTIDYVKAVDGQNIRLRVTKSIEGDESYVKAGVLTYFTGIGGLFVKGKDVVVDAGTEYTIFIDGERRINLGTPPR